VVTGDFVRTGGMDVANYHLARYLAGHGHVVHLVAHRVDADLRDLPNVDWHHVAKPFNSYTLGRWGLARTGQRWGRSIAEQGGVFVANGGNCLASDVNWVHYVHAGHRPTVARSMTRRALGAWNYRQFVTAERTAVRAARVVIANSERTRRDLVDGVQAAAERIHTVYYGADASYHRPPYQDERRTARQMLGWNDGRPGVAFVGALGDRRKGFDVLFAAWRELCADRGWDARLVVVGAGQELANWRRRAADEHLGSRIQFLGFTNEVRRVFWACDAVVAPARYEAYGLAVHEAVCCGLPAIVNADAGVAERLGALAALQPSRPDDPMALAEALRRWHDARAHWAHVAEPVSHALRAWSWDDMAARIVALAEESR
jgi:glycosyltransferase involved in cell wall biosynthesis